MHTPHYIGALASQIVGGGGAGAGAGGASPSQVAHLHLDRGGQTLISPVGPVDWYGVVHQNNWPWSGPTSVVTVPAGISLVAAEFHAISTSGVLTSCSVGISKNGEVNYPLQWSHQAWVNNSRRYLLEVVEGDTLEVEFHPFGTVPSFIPGNNSTFFSLVGY